MKWWNSILSVLLLLSLAINLWLYSQLGHRLEVTSDAIQDELPGPNNNPLTISKSPSLITKMQHTGQLDSQLLEQVLRQTGNQQKQQWLAQVRQWLEQGKYQQVKAFLQLYLQYYPQDIDFLMLEADCMVKTELLSRALEHYYQLLEYPLSDIQYQQIQSTIYSLAFDTISQLRKVYSWDILAAFVEPLWQIEPTKREYILALAEAYSALSQGNLMESTLASLAYDDPDAMQIRQHYARLIQQAEPLDEIELSTERFNRQRPIKLQQFGDQFVVPAVLNRNKINLLIDTGASMTAISQRHFIRNQGHYQARFIGRFSVHTASGEETAPMYQFAQLAIGEHVVNNITLVVLPMSGFESSDGLLGMNFLREFDFKIDQQVGLLYLLGI
ncbi:retropepsin-like aspartic protease family protein [Neptunicella sp. SCSIO 80796]|uniref:retropepsin-like aspartic protease family protein n=1 Tax=Neptunicella plasticusilytica TaxID=3117012 RepID=UPI003A4D7426